MITGYVCLRAESIACQFSDVPSRATGFRDSHITTEDFKQSVEQNLKYTIKIIKINLQRSM